MAESSGCSEQRAPTLADLDLRLPTWLAPSVYRALGLAQLEASYREARARHRARPTPRTAAEFCEDALSALGQPFAIEDAVVERLSAIEGPLVFVANHPFGVLDALLLLAVVGRVRRDFLFLANSIASVFPELVPILLPVRIHDHEHVAQRRQANVRAMRRAHATLQQGGCVVGFPAGEVAELRSWRTRTSEERMWHPHIGALIARHEACVVPVYFAGQNSWRFRYLGKLMPPLRVVLMAGELRHPRPPIKYAIGEAQRFMRNDNPTKIVERLRKYTLSLADQMD